MTLNLDRKLALLGNRFPARLLGAFVRASLGRQHLALGFHRVRSPSTEEINAGMSIPEEDLDAAIEFFLAAYPERPERWLTVTLDDGYEDAAVYVESRAGRFPGVDFVLFVCPEKAEHGAGFRWDLAETLRQAGEPADRITGILRAPEDVETENAREDLRRVGTDPRFRLAGVDRLRSIAESPNVLIGNHTNCHFELSLLRPHSARLELERSQATFERLFGRQVHFAFPFGHGFFDESHLRLLRAIGGSVLWGTGQSPHAPADRASGALLPRIAIEGPLDVRGIAAVVAGRSLVTWALGVRSVARRGRRHAYQFGER